MSAEIEFGDLEQTAPRTALRPDRNRHYAVAACHSPNEQDLPIFVDLDVIRDMEDHAASDTSVELGGVLLGGQYVDEEGRSFVVITDSLRAKHYKSTKGSFKFTHETWTAITRERDEFPKELQMVGWYHTHPDWGVFLSSMDMFICDHFFNRPLDVALVIDPCRGDRGFFQWTGDPRERIRRTGGFYLTASRFRQAELEEFAAFLESETSMAANPRLSGYSQGSYSAPVIHLHDQRSAWQWPAVLGLLTVQLLLLTLVAWRAFTPADPEPQQLMVRQLDLLDRRLQSMQSAERAEVETAAQARLLKAIVAEVKGEEAAGLVDAYRRQERYQEQLEAGLRAQIVLEKQLREQQQELQLALDRNRAQYASLSKNYEKLEKQANQYAAKLKQIEKPAEEETPPEEKKEGRQLLSWSWTWWTILGTSTALLLIAVGAVALVVVRRRELAQDDEVES